MTSEGCCLISTGFRVFRVHRVYRVSRVYRVYRVYRVSSRAEGLGLGA